MNQANQQVVIQNANMNLIQIRSYELSYFSTFFSNFGTQAALMIGFILGSLSQVPGLDNPTDAHYFWIVMYWIPSAICLSAGIHCLVCTVFVQVYGQGLALRGPLGSMVKTIEGMVAEQQQILVSFNITIFSFGFQCIGMYWIMMDSTSAIVTTIITAVFIAIWYRYALRLYNRFSWSNIKVDYLEAEENDTNPLDALEALNPNAVQDLQSSGRSKQNSKKSILDYTVDKRKTGTKSGSKGSVLGDDSKQSHSDMVSDMDRSYSKGRDDDAASVAHSSIMDAAFSEMNEEELAKASAQGGTLGAYLSLKERGTFGRENWVRRYFILKGQLVFYYLDKRSFQLEPSKPIIRRAIDLEGYTLVAGASEPPYPISLVPLESEDIRKVWRFRCDTLAEFNNWVQAFSTALKLANGNREQGELLVIADGKSEILSRRGDQQADDDEDD